MRRWLLGLVVIAAACGGGNDDGPSGQAGPDDPSATTVATLPATSTPTTAPSSATTVVAPGPLAPRLDTAWLIDVVQISGGEGARPSPAEPNEVRVTFRSADAGEAFAVVAGATAVTGPPVLGPFSGLGSTETIGQVQVRLFSGRDPARPGSNLEVAAFACRDLSIRLVGRDLGALGEATSVAGRLVNAMACNA